MGTPTSGGSLDYTVGDSSLTVSYRDITTLAVDVIVSSDDRALTMSGGVSGAIRAAAGDDVYGDAQKAGQDGRLRVGDVVVTRPGRLAAKYVFHAVVIEKLGTSATAEVIRSVVRRCLDLCVEKGLRSIAFPALGIGAGRLKPEESASAIVVETCAYLPDHPEIESVFLALDPLSGGERVELFYRKIQEYLQLSAAVRHLDRAVEDLGRFQLPTAPVSLTSDLTQLTQVRSELDNSMIGVAASDFSTLSAPKSAAALRKTLDALDTKLAEAIAKAAEDPANTRFKADRLRLQIEQARLELLQLDLEDRAEGLSTDVRQQRRALLLGQEGKFQSELSVIEAGSAPLVLSLHGIRTRGTWQKDVTLPLNAAGFNHVPIDYGRFGLLRFLTPGARAKQVDAFRDAYRRKGAETAKGHPSLIAHSLGSYIATKAMAKYDLKFDRIILCGAIVKTDYDWDTMFGGGYVTQVLNDHGGLDIWARVAEYVVVDAGRSGLTGFDKTGGGKLTNRHHKRFEHSDYFYEGNYDNWIRFLRGQALTPLANPADTAANWRFRLMLLGALVLAVLLYLFVSR